MKRLAAAALAALLWPGAASAQDTIDERAAAEAHERANAAIRAQREPAPPAPAAAPAAPAARQSAANVDTACVRRLTQQRLEMIGLAQRCATHVHVMGAMRSDQVVPARCGPQPPGYIDQTIAQQACGRVYACAANALKVAIDEVKGGMECTAAQHAGMARWPIPRP